MHSLPVGDATLHVDVALKRAGRTSRSLIRWAPTCASGTPLSTLCARADVGWLRFDLARPWPLRSGDAAEAHRRPRRRPLRHHEGGRPRKGDDLRRLGRRRDRAGARRRHPECVENLVLCCTGAKIGTDESWNQRIAAIERGGLGAVAEGVLQRWFPPHDYAKGGGAVALCRNMLARTAERRLYRDLRHAARFGPDRRGAKSEGAHPGGRRRIRRLDAARIRQDAG